MPLHTIHILSRLSGALACVALLTSVGAPRVAHACGGTFCEQQNPGGPTVMPVNQTGETIAFRLHEGRVEAHIQIAYNGDPEEFAWLVPVTAIPDVGVGSSAFFASLLNSTVPTYSMDFQPSGSCGVPVTGFSCGGFTDVSAGAEGDTGAAQEEPESDTADTPEIVKRGLAGAFEYVVLEGQTVEEITTWLDNNGFAQDDDAPPILEEYLEEGFYFLALKLRSGAGVDEIHPLTIDYEGDEPCVPIRLTRIAAEEDMGIRAFFLGEHRVAPKNFEHVVLNETAISWLPLLAENYDEVVTAAVDEAGGRAFVTEYAGSSEVVSQVALVNLDWDPAAFAALSEDQIADQLALVLEGQGLLSCVDGGCTWGHPLISGIIDDFVTLPEGVSADEFWSCTSCYEDQLDTAGWDGALFAARFDERVLQPGLHASTILGENPYLTRLYTTMSPHEMLEDPMFWENADLPEVDAAHTSTRLGNCAGPDWISFPDGRQVALAESFRYPEIAGLPFAERVERIPMVGAPMVELDNGALIDELLEDWNAGFEFSDVAVEEDGVDGVEESSGALCSATARRLSRDPGAWLFLGILLYARRPRRRR